MTRFKRLMMTALLGFAVFIALCMYMHVAMAETYWIPATEKYYKYDTTPTRTAKVYKYIATTDIETVRSTWVKQNKIYAKYTTINGGLKYVEEVIVTQPVPIEPVCPAFKCVDDFGLTYDLTKNTVMKCPMVQFKKGVPSEYDGAQAGTDRCR